MSHASPFQLNVHDVTCGPLQHLSFAWTPGVHWVCGDEGTGKTTLLRLLASDLQPTTGNVVTPDGGVFWVDLQNPAHDTTTVQTCWDTLHAQHAHWDEAVLNDLAEALKMEAHREKQLHMLSAGSRRKVMVIAALASGATVTLLDQPFAALDFGSIRVIQAFLQEASEHPSRAWIVADYTTPSHIPLASVLNLDEHDEWPP